jgi:orotidine-5'-phosphate decarboxylase
MSKALSKLQQAQARTGSLLSIGLEPCAEYLPAGLAPDLGNYEAFLRDVIEAGAERACAFKFNLAHFEALGWEGMELLYCVREMIPADCFVIADGKRGDIGSTARHYATAIYDKLEADAATLNPLMGRDSAEPFLAYADKLSIFLILTSNPGAADFLLRDGLYKHVARTVAGWGEANVGFVTGATRPEMLGELRTLAPSVPFLIPGLGAQGGDLAATLRHGAGGPMILHVTRAILPGKDEKGDPADIMARRIDEWNSKVEEARG